MESYSQIGQDLFVINHLKEKKEGTYLDIGCGHPVNINNTYILEKNYGWSGLSIDFDESHKKEWEERRKNKITLDDALSIDYDRLIGDFLKDKNTDRIDYLSMDLEPPMLTLEVLLKIPLNKYKFSVITFEHDCYRCATGQSSPEILARSREIFEKFGYVMNFSNWQEDWWVDPSILRN